MNKKIRFLTKASVIGALYAVLTIFSAVFGLAYGEIQFRISEALTILPLFTSAAVPGLTVGCIVANIFSSVNPLDTVIGSAATLLSAVLTRKCRGITIKGFPFLSMVFPVLFNALLVGAEIAFFSSSDSFWSAFGLCAVSVGAGEGAVVFTLGTALIIFLQKNKRLQKIISR